MNLWRQNISGFGRLTAGTLPPQYGLFPMLPPQFGGDVLAKGYVTFLKYFRDLQAQALERNDESFPYVSEDYLNALEGLATEQQSLKKQMRKMTREEKQSIDAQLQEEYDELKADEEWNTFVHAKDTFSFDPNLTAWVIQNYLSGMLLDFEDIEMLLKPAVENWRWLQRKGIIEKKTKITDLDLDAVLTLVEENEGALQEKIKEEQVQQELQLIYDGNEIKVYMPTTEAAACHVGQGTKWCTAATEGDNMFSHYNAKGPLYVVQPKYPLHDGEKYQLHFETNQYMDERDHEIDLCRLLQKFPELRKALPEHLRNSKLKKMMLTDNSERGRQVGKCRLVTSIQKLLQDPTDTDFLLQMDKKQLFGIFMNAIKFAPRVVPIFIDTGVNVNATTKAGVTALMLAAVHTLGEAIVPLLNAGADVNAQIKDGMTALMYAAQNSFISTKLLIDAGADVNATTKSGETALMFAAKASATAIIKALLDAGADINAKTKSGATALMFAARSSPSSIVKALLEAGADVNAIDNKNKTALSYLMEGDDLDVINEPDPELIATLVSAGADVNVTYFQGETPLFYAVKIHNLSLINALLHAGADVNASDKYTGTVLQFAVRIRSSVQIISSLINAGADVNVKNRQDESLIKIAVTQPRFEVVQLLFNAGADAYDEKEPNGTAYWMAKKQWIIWRRQTDTQLNQTIPRGTPFALTRSLQVEHEAENIWMFLHERRPS
jgi:ankyrin repeat protein